MKTEFSKLMELNPGDVPIHDTDYAQWLIENHSGGWHRLNDLKGYLEHCGFDKAVHKTPEGAIDRLGSIHSLVAYEAIKSDERFRENVAAYITYLERQSPIISDSHTKLWALYQVYGRKKVDAELERQFNQEGNQ
jgi:hypothetical protein